MVMVKHYRLLRKTDSTKLVGRKKITLEEAERTERRCDAGGRSRLVRRKEWDTSLWELKNGWKQEICIKQNQAWEIGQICGESQGRKESEKSTDYGESYKVRQMALNTHGTLNLLGQPNSLNLGWMWIVLKFSFQQWPGADYKVIAHLLELRHQGIWGTHVFRQLPFNGKMNSKYFCFFDLTWSS